MLVRAQVGLIERKVALTALGGCYTEEPLAELENLSVRALNRVCSWPIGC